MNSLSHASRNLLPTLLLIAGSFISAEAADRERNWPEWRGPNANGLVLHGNPPVEWSEDRNIKWKVRIPGSGHATPIIWENRIFILTAVPSAGTAQIQPPRTVLAQAQGQRPRRGGGGPPRFPRGERPTIEHAFTVLCLDRETGKVQWEKIPRREVPYQNLQPSNSFSSASPLTDGERLYVYFGSHGLYCYDLEGNLIWQKDLGKLDVMFGEGSSPALWENILVVVQDTMEASHVYAFDTRTGQELWKKQRDERSGWTTPYILTAGGRTQAVISGSNAIRSYDVKTGEVIWQCSGLGSNPVPMVVADDTAVYAMSGHRPPTVAMAIKLGPTGDLTDTDAVLWKFDRGTPYVPSPLLYGENLFFCQRNDPLITCLDRKTGQAHYAQHRLQEIVGVYASPIGVQNRIYLPGQNGVTVVLENSKEVRVLASNKLDDGFDASPAVVGNELFLRGRSHLYCIAGN